jgi:DNA-binding NarL/FixJ family response regulator
LIGVIIADDNAQLREVLKTGIESTNEIQVVASVEDGYQALSHCEISLPDLVLMDINMPNCDGIKGTKLVKIRFPFVKILIMTVSGDDQNLQHALSSGADGYLLKPIETEKVIKAIQNTINGITTIEPGIFIPVKT